MDYKIHNTAEEALVELTEATLATVEYLLDLSKPPKGELNRQMGMAQSAILVIAHQGLDASKAQRVRAVIKSGANVPGHYGWNG